VCTVHMYGVLVNHLQGRVSATSPQPPQTSDTCFPRYESCHQIRYHPAIAKASEVIQ
jgi:hypothetical protein